ncbi:MAG: aspartate aminotransferase family protein [Gemmatimonadaceae bacterium]
MLSSHLNREEQHYLARTPRSAELYARALGAMPGGDTRTGTFVAPYPTFMSHGRGVTMWDVDGNSYRDFLGNFTALIHGHAHPEITRAMVERAPLGTAFPFAHALQVELADVIRGRVPSIERLRFCNSGTEAVLGAIRAARAFTGRPRILKFEGGYHGSYDAAQVSVAPTEPLLDFPRGAPSGPGVSPGMLAEVLVAPFNDLGAAARLIKAHAHELAAVLLEPAMTAAGVIPPNEGFLTGLIHAAHQAGVLVILDEIITLRLGFGGGQGLFGIRPDLTTLGKIIGGGLPVGAFGGRADIMAVYDPRAKGTIAHSGTFNGNAMTMAAGLASMALLTPAAIMELEATGAALRAGLQRVIADLRISATVTGLGSLAHIHFCDGPIENYRDALRADRSVTRVMHLGLLNRGFACASRGMFAISTATTATDVSDLLVALHDVLAPLAELATVGREIRTLSAR